MKWESCSTVFNSRVVQSSTESLNVSDIYGTGNVNIFSNSLRSPLFYHCLMGLTKPQPLWYHATCAMNSLMASSRVWCLQAQVLELQVGILKITSDPTLDQFVTYFSVCQGPGKNWTLKPWNSDRKLKTRQWICKLEPWSLGALGARFSKLDVRLDWAFCILDFQTIQASQLARSQLLGESQPEI